MNTESLDAKIRTKARAELIEGIESAVAKFKEVLGMKFRSGDTINVRCSDNKHVHVYIPDVLEKLVKLAIKEQAPKIEDAAVAEFLGQVESLQDQIDELNNG